MNLLLMMHGFPPAILRKSDLQNTTKPGLERIIARAVDRSLDIYLNAITGESPLEEIKTPNLLKIGELAKASGQTVPTIRFWTKEGLLTVTEITESNYHLYSHDMIPRAKQIKLMQNKRMTLGEIKQRLL
jgi:hypothetical protein